MKKRRNRNIKYRRQKAGGNVSAKASAESSMAKAMCVCQLIYSASMCQPAVSGVINQWRISPSCNEESINVIQSESQWLYQPSESENEIQ